MKIYTKTGDTGKTGLIGGTRVLKSDLRIEAYGTIDELNSCIGLLRAYPHTDDNNEFLSKTQHFLFSVGSYLATDTEVTEIKQASVISDAMISDIEKQIDRLNENLPELRQFILPGGSVESAQAHICRTVARRAERRIIELAQQYQMDNNVVKYINRLSDYFFVLARYLNINGGYKEIFWKRSK